MAEFFAHDTADISEKANIGQGTRIWHHAQIRENTIVGENVNIGKSVYIDEGVTIGSNVKIQNMSSVYKGVTIEDDVFIGPHVAFTNDFRPRAFTKDFKIVKTLVKKGASIGANSTIVCGVKIGEYAMIGAASLVSHDVPDHGLVYGNPARLKGFVCECGEKMKKMWDGDDFDIFECSCSKELKLEKRISRLIK